MCVIYVQRLTDKATELNASLSSPSSASSYRSLGQAAASDSLASGQQPRAGEASDAFAAADGAARQRAAAEVLQAMAREGVVPSPAVCSALDTRSLIEASQALNAALAPASRSCRALNLPDPPNTSGFARRRGDYVHPTP